MINGCIVVDRVTCWIQVVFIHSKPKHMNRKPDAYEENSDPEHSVVRQKQAFL